MIFFKSFQMDSNQNKGHILTQRQCKTNATYINIVATLFMRVVVCPFRTALANPISGWLRVREIRKKESCQGKVREIICSVREKRKFWAISSALHLLRKIGCATFFHRFQHLGYAALQNVSESQGNVREFEYYKIVTTLPSDSRTESRTDIKIMSSI